MVGVLKTERHSLQQLRKVTFQKHIKVFIRAMEQKWHFEKNAIEVQLLNYVTNDNNIILLIQAEKISFSCLLNMVQICIFLIILVTQPCGTL